MNWQEVKARLSEFQADPLSRLSYLNELRDRCREGIKTDKVNARLEIPMEVTEHFPALELQITQEIGRIATQVYEHCETSDPEGLSISINVLPLEVN
jgi:hypothetical protein